MTKAALSKGLTRILIVLSAFWVGNCLIVQPRKAASEWENIAISARVYGDNQRANNAAAEADVAVQIKRYWSSPYIWCLTLVPPLFAYGILRLALSVGAWIHSGFRTTP
jgi:hypothetical protein